MKLPDSSSEFSFRQSLEPVAQKVETFAKEKPTHALSAAVGVGIILAILPIGGILSGLLRLAFAVLRPILMVFGVLRIYESLGARRARSEKTEGPVVE